MRGSLRGASGALFTRSAKQMARMVGTTSMQKVLKRVGTITIDFEQFGKEIQRLCEGQCVGFGWAVFERDRPFKSGGDGEAVRRERSFDADTRLNVHSLSKTVAAAAIVHALHFRPDLSLDARIGDWLHPGWAIDNESDVRRITLKQLLVHDSGLDDEDGKDDSGGRSLRAVRLILQTGLSEPEDARHYQNVNFSLCRMLLPFITDGGRPTESAALNRMGQDEFNHATVDSYVKYIHDHFAIDREIGPAPNGDPPFTRYYFLSPLDTQGHGDLDDKSPFDLEEFAGASAWFMSATEFGKFLVDLRFSQRFGAPDERWSPWDVMCDFDHRTQPDEETEKFYRLGMHEMKIGMPSPIVALTKTGGGPNAYGPTTAWIAFGDLTAVLVINSMGGFLEGEKRLEADEVLRAAAKVAIVRTT